MCYYADYDRESACWGVFHTDVNPNWCRALFSVQEEAEEYASELNDTLVLTQQPSGAIVYTVNANRSAT